MTPPEARVDAVCSEIFGRLPLNDDDDDDDVPHKEVSQLSVLFMSTSLNNNRKREKQLSLFTATMGVFLQEMTMTMDV